MRQSAPFAREPEPAFRLAHRCLDWANLDEPGALLLTEHDRDRRWLTTWLCYPAEPRQEHACCSTWPRTTPTAILARR